MLYVVPIYSGVAILCRVITRKIKKFIAKFVCCIRIWKHCSGAFGSSNITRPGVRPKEKIVLLTSRGVFESLGWSAEICFVLFCFLIILVKAPKMQTLGAFSTFFLKKNNNLIKIGYFPDWEFFIYFFWDGWVAEGNKTFFPWPNG